MKSLPFRTRGLKIYATALAVFFLLDMLWLGVLASGFYQDQIGFLLREDPLWPAAAAFYLLYVFALTHFTVLPHIANGNVRSAAANGGLFGFATYAAYDLTNLAVTKDWPVPVTLVDLAWGSILGALVAGLTTKVFARC